MASVVVMPQLGNTVESCLIVAWNVSVGDEIAEGTILCEVETDKSSMEVPSSAAGTILALLCEVDDDVPVKAPIAIVGAPGEDISELLASVGSSSEGGTPETAAPENTAASAGTSVPQAANAAPAASAPAPTGDANAPVSPRAKNLAAAKNLDLAYVAGGTGPHGRIIERDVAAVLESIPDASRAARAYGLPTGVEGSGLGGRVLTTDETSAAGLGASPSAMVVSETGLEFPGAFEDTPIKGIRKVIAERMMYSLQSSAQLTLHTSAPADGLLALRKRCKDSDASLGLNGVTLGDMVSFAATRVIGNYAMMNAHLEDNVMRSFADVHLGMAVDTPRGLVVPTVRFASRMSIRQLSEQIKALAAQSIEGSISPDLLTGATFTITNLGAFGIEAFTPVLNVPQTAILGVNTITPRCVADEYGDCVTENRIGLSLTIDHRVVDGADGARFLKDLSNAIANIDLIIAG
ncbi:MAG: dihydrolipoamide acetyltransferase family protein [Actinomycetaceae bacterium]|nr:dihydrolipoamide acetyltransferase family protein [Actinomycetaceae bacterium]